MTKDLRHRKGCPWLYGNGKCDCDIEQRLRDRIEQLEAAIVEHRRIITVKHYLTDEDKELYKVLDE